MPEGKDKVAKNDDARANLSAAKRALLEKHLRGEVAGAGGPAATIPRRRGGDSAPLSFAQQRMWFFDQMEPGTSVYNIRKTLRVRGRLDVGALERSLNEIVRRHESLRTTFTSEGGEPSQRVAAEMPLRLETFDLRGVAPHAREGEALRLAREESRRPFDLSAGPLLRARLFVLGDEDRVLALTMHHIISDGWSLDVMMRELTVLYEAYTRGQESPLAELPVQYGDYSAWQREWLAGERLEAQLAYWKRKLEGAPTVLELPSDRPRPAVQTYHGAQHLFSLPAELSSALAELGRSERATLFMVLLSAWEVLLSHYARQEEFLVGTPVANRTRAETEPLIGFFANTLVLRADLRGDPTFRELVRRVGGDCLDAYAHQDVPFEKLVEELRPPRDLSRTPLFQVMFLLQNMGGRAGKTVGLSLTPVEAKVEATQFDLTLDMRETSRGLAGAIEYNTDFFEAATVARMSEHFTRLLEGAAADPSARVSELPLAGEEERRLLVEGFNRTARDYEREPPCVHRMFERQAARTPDAVAVEYEGGRVSYGELNERAERIAALLSEAGVGAESRVAVLLERSPEMVAALLGVLKAGAAYVPLDPAYPRERLRFMLEDSGAQVLLTVSRLQERVDGQGAKVVLLDEDAGGGAGVGRRRVEVAGANLAYVIYTSGSTGTPKGTLVEHGALANYISSAAETFDLKESDRVLQFASISFDAAAEEIFTCLARGAALVLRTERMLGTAAEFLRTCGSMGVSVLDLPTAFWHLLVDELHAGRAAMPECVRLVIIGGEKARAEQVRRWHEAAGPSARLINTYGPTETTVVATACELRADVNERAKAEVPIGRPVANVRAYVLDERLRPAPLGVTGELYVGGAGLARGYLNRPALTAERFIPDPFAATPGARLYRTGDLVRYRADGMIEYVGRADTQVKLRGFRVELGEVEAALSRHPSVAGCAVVVRERAGGGAEQRLVAYSVLSAERARPSAGELRRFVGEALPAYMVPSAFVFTDALPLTPSGKVDRKALPEPDWGGVLLEEAHVAPRTPVEDVLAGTWSEVLGVERVGVNDNFFDLGGHSLLATQIISRVRDAFSLEVPLQQLFEHPTVAGLAGCVERAMRRGDGVQTPPLARVPREGPLPLSFAQQRLWFIEQLEPGTPLYNVPFALRLTGALDVEALRRSLDEVVRRHEALRTSFPRHDGEPVQVVNEHRPLELHVTDLSGLGETEREERALSAAREEAQRPFDLSTGPLLRASVLRLGEEEHVLLVTMHHIASDGWSVGVLVREFSALYEAFVSGEPAALPELPIQYADFAVWQREWLRGDALEGQLSYWREQLSGLEPLELPTDFARTAEAAPRAASASLLIPAGLADRLRRLSRREGATLFMTLLAGYYALLSRYSGRSDIAVGTDIANRHRSEVEPLIGFFVNQLVLRADLSAGPSFVELLAQTRRTVLGAYAHQDLPFEKLVEELNPRRDLSRTPLFQAKLVMQNAPGGALQLPRLRAEAVEAGAARLARFDLTLFVSERADGLAAALEYSADLFSGETAMRLLTHFAALLAAAAEEPSRPVAALPLLSEAERRRLLHEFNDTARPFPPDDCLHRLFSAQAARTPHATAVACGARSLTYAELEARSNRLAHYLASMGVGAEVRVGVYLNRSAELVVALLGVLKAGAAYLPLDPQYPTERLSFLIEDGGCPVVLTESGLSDSLPASMWLQVVSLDEALAETASLPEADPCAEVAADNLAYVIYTSGSTGTPKGVAVTHASACNYVRWAAGHYPAGGAAPLFTSPAFDLTVTSIFPVLAAGGTVEVVAGEGAEALAEVGRSGRGYGLVKLTPSHLDLLTRVALREGAGGGGPRPGALVIGGEALGHESLRAWRELSPATRLFNEYGPTEATVGCCVYEAGAAGEGAVPIGTPIENTRLYVVDSRGEPAPVGVAGELLIGGRGLARGYLNRPELTAERFVPDPFSGEEGARLYRSGDLVRRRSDGVLEYLGRMDGQVKVRGFRIEPGEVEAALLGGGRVRAAAVVVREDEPGDKRLVAYVVAAGEGAAAEAELREHLKGRLPEYMVPAHFVTLDALPLTPNGKLDRKALPKPGQERGAVGEFIAPSTVVEEVVAGIWSEVLGVERVGVHDNFFNLGGHSLLAIQLISRVHEVLGVELQLRDFFEAPTVAEWAREVERKKAEEAGDDFLSDILGEIQGLSPEQIRSELDAARRAEGKADADG